MQGTAPLLDPVYRRARRGDIRSMLAHLHTSPHAFGPSLGHAELEPLLVRLLADEAIEATLLVDGPSAGTGAPREILALAITAFLRAELAADWAAAPPEAFVDTVFELERTGQRPLLRRSEVAVQNSSGNGLELAFLGYASPLGGLANPAFSSLVALTHDMFRIFHAGYHCRRAFHPAVKTPGGNPSLEAMGFRPVREGSDLLVHDLEALEHAPFHPFIILRRSAPPVLGLSPAEQAMLLGAVLGLNDAQLSEELGLSEETIRKRWRRAFERFSARSGGSALEASTDDGAPRAGRGPEKRRHLLRYLATHLEELRPYRVPAGRLPK